MNQNFFCDDLDIVWTKVLCPVCAEPTGPKANCVGLVEENNETIPIYKRIFNDPGLGIIPILSNNCSFRKNNMWHADINYPVSSPMLQILETIPGLDRIVPNSSYGFDITIGRIFKEEDVKRDINISLRNLIKSLQAEELDELKLETEDDVIMGIEMPNGKTFMIPEKLSDEERVSQINYIKILSDQLEKSRIIYSDNVNPM